MPSRQRWGNSLVPSIKLGLVNEHGQHYEIQSPTIGRARTDAEYDDLNVRMYGAVSAAGGFPKMSVRDPNRKSRVCMQCSGTDEKMMRRALQGVLE